MRNAHIMTWNKGRNRNTSKWDTNTVWPGIWRETL